MPITKIQNGLSGDNKGSSSKAISYLEKEQKFKDKSMRKDEPFFNQKGLNFTGKEAVKKLDSKRQGLGVNKAKYFSLIISPSAKELANLSDSNLKDFTKNAMEDYCKNFYGRVVDPQDLVWFAKLEHTRTHKGYKKGKNEQLPAGKKSGDFKSGDNRHIHILVRLKTEKGISISPLANPRGSDKNFGTGTKIGFDRIKFFQKTEDLLYNKIKENNPNYKLNTSDLFAGRYLKSEENYHNYDRAIKIGILPKTVAIIKKINEKNAKPNEVKTKGEKAWTIKAEIFKINTAVLKDKPKDLEDYYLKMRIKNVAIFPIFDDKEKLIDLELTYKGENFKNSEVDKSMSLGQTKRSINKIKTDKTSSIRSEIFSLHKLALKEEPKNKIEYQKFLITKGVTILPTKDKFGKLQGFRVAFKGQYFKASEVHRSMSLGNLNKSLKEIREDGRPKENTIIRTPNLNQEQPKATTSKNINNTSLKGEARDLKSNESGEKSIGNGIIKPGSGDVEEDLIVHTAPNRKKKKKKGFKR